VCVFTLVCFVCVHECVFDSVRVHECVFLLIVCVRVLECVFILCSCA